MKLMLRSAERVEGQEQPYIPLGLLKLRIPFVHFEWELPEMFQGMIVFIVCVSATSYLQDLFGVSWEVALAIVCVHDILYAVQNIFGDPMVGGWITPAIPLIGAYLGTIPAGPDRVHALIALQLILGLLFVVLGLTGVAGKLVSWVPSSVKSGILIGAGISAIIGKYGFLAVEKGGIGFFKHPISFSVGVLISLFTLFSLGFKQKKHKTKGKNIFVNFMAKAGLVPSILMAFLIGIIVKEIALPQFTGWGWFNFPKYLISDVFPKFSIIGIGFPPLRIIIKTIPMALITYFIAFGDIVAGTEFLKETDKAREDEVIDVNPNRTNFLCGIRNLIQAFFCPTVTMSGPLWTAMMVSIAERYKAGKENMYSIFGGAATFDIAKAIACMWLPLLMLVKPVLPVSMSLTLMVQAFGSFYVAFGLVNTNQERGVAGIVGGILAIAGPAVGLIAGIIVAIVVQFLAVDKNYKMDL